jgi:hypothetical protein
VAFNHDTAWSADLAIHVMLVRVLVRGILFLWIVPPMELGMLHLRGYFARLELI